MASDIHNEAIAWLARLNRESLSVEDEAAFFAWLQQSEAHQAAYIKAEQLWLRGDTLSRAARVDRAQPTLGLWLGGLAAVCCLAVALVIGWPLAPAYTPLQAGSEVAEFALPDGSVITLKAGTTLAYSFHKNTRDIRLTQGEAFFDVAHNPAKPFIVNTEYGVVKVLGTQFSVGLNEQDANVLVLSGSVEVLPENHTDKAVLTKNQAVSFQQVTSGVMPVEIKAAQLLSWRHQQWVFENTPLSEAAAAIEQALGQAVAVPFEYAALPVTGVLPTTEPLQALKTIATSHGLVVQETSAGLQLIKAL